MCDTVAHKLADMTQEEIEKLAEKEATHTLKVYEGRPNHKSLVRTWTAGYNTAQEEYQVDAEKWKNIAGDLAYDLQQNNERGWVSVENYEEALKQLWLWRREQ